MGKFDMKKHLREARRDYKLKLGDLMDLALENYKKYLETGDKAALLISEEHARLFRLNIENFGDGKSVSKKKSNG